MADTDAQHLDALLHEIGQEQEGFTYDGARIEEETVEGGSVLKKLPVKVLTILGGLLATSTFTAFFMSAGLYESGIGLLLLGLCFLAGAELLIRNKKGSTTDAVGVSLYITGYVLLAMGTGQLSESGTAVAVVLASAALLIVVLSGSAVNVFVSVLVLSGSLMSLILIHKLYDLSHVLIVILAALLAYMSLSEAKLVSASPEWNMKYGPIRMGLIFSLVAMLALFVHQKFLSTTVGHFWISSLFLIACLLLLVHRVVKEAALQNRKAHLVIYSCCVLMLVPFILTPSVPGALLILLSSFYMGHKAGFWVGLLALVYFMVLYYYDLNMTLLAKSGVLVASGLLFLIGFVLFNKFLKSDDA